MNRRRSGSGEWEDGRPHAKKCVGRGRKLVTFRRLTGRVVWRRVPVPSASVSSCAHTCVYTCLVTVFVAGRSSVSTLVSWVRVGLTDTFDVPRSL